MSFRTISFDAQAVSELQKLVSLIPNSFDYTTVLEIGTMTIEGKDIQAHVENLINENDENLSEILIQLTKTIPVFLWECAKSAPRDARLLADVLGKLEIGENFVVPFVEFYRTNKRRFIALKDLLKFHMPQYKDFSWRIDMEVSRRSLKNVTVPKFLCRLDLQSTEPNIDFRANSSYLQHSEHLETVNSSLSPSSHSSYHNHNNNNSQDSSCFQYAIDQDNRGDHSQCSLLFQMDYSHLKHIQQELQSALNEFSDVHTQRLTRYIS